MYIHLGGDVTVSSKSIISIIDLNKAQVTQKSISDFISFEDNRNRLQYISDDIPQSIIITDERTYISPISVLILTKRTFNNVTNVDIYG